MFVYNKKKCTGKVCEILRVDEITQNQGYVLDKDSLPRLSYQEIAPLVNPSKCKYKVCEILRVVEITQNQGFILDKDSILGISYQEIALQLIPRSIYTKFAKSLELVKSRKICILGEDSCMD
eukprot:TRINITY_DN1514_c1_g1_i2.p6 TRINITY_DN1514_c1_g1~~TRINITY_DN1514_c1_g1_i2.p6  ORF type:complete len:122 (-),score=3.97 TRINITY_DN1514_c1_g1_i2:1085-1450(-)